MSFTLTSYIPVKRQRKVHTFTLMELMIVLLILGFLAALVTPNMLKKAEKAKHKTAQLQVKLLANTCKDYYLDTGEYPQRLEDLVKDTGDPDWNGPYLVDPPKIPKDPWDEPYRYDYPGQHAKFDIYSYGADKAPGGEKYDADIGNWK